DVGQRDRGEVGAEAAGAQAGRDDGHGLPGGDELELVLDGLDQGTARRRASVRPGVDAPEGVWVRPGPHRHRPGQGSLGLPGATAPTAGPPCTGWTPRTCSGSPWRQRPLARGCTGSTTRACRSVTSPTLSAGI